MVNQETQTLGQTVTQIESDDRDLVLALLTAYRSVFPNLHTQSEFDRTVAAVSDKQKLDREHLKVIRTSVGYGKNLYGSGLKSTVDPDGVVSKRLHDLDRRIAADHVLKTVQPFFDHVASGVKTFEIRENDRGFKVGDRVLLREYDPHTEMYSGESILIEITYTLSGFYPVPHNWMVFSFDKLAQ